MNLENFVVLLLLPYLLGSMAMQGLLLIHGLALMSHDKLEYLALVVINIHLKPRHFSKLYGYHVVDYK